MKEIAVLVLFFMSGVSALAYEVVWQSRLANMIGATSLSAAMVLAVFMGGLALGAAIAPKVISRFFRGNGTRGPMALFFLAEGAIGVWALASPLSFGLASHLGGPAGTLGLKPLVDFLLVAVVMLPPAFLMGLTLPALTGHLAARKLRESLGAAYFMNVSGGAAGSLAWGLWLIPAFGLRFSELCAAGVNLTIAAVAFTLARGMKFSGAEPFSLVETAQRKPKNTEVSRDPISEEPKRLEGIVLPALAIFAASGLSMALEVLFFRFNLLVVGASAHSFSIMLAAFLIGISGGTAVARSFIARGVEPMKVSFISCLVALAGLAGAGFLCERLPFIFHVARSSVGGSYRAWLAVKGLFCGLVTLLPAAGLGALFPALHSEIARHRGGESDATSGLASAISCAGALAGSVAAGLIFLPLAGLSNSLGAASGITALLGCVLIAATSWGARGKTTAGAVTLMLGAAAWFWFATTGHHTFISGVFYREASYRGVESFKEFRRINGSRAVVFFMDDGEALVSVTSRDGYLGLQVNGKTDASNMPDDMATQLALGHLPALFRRGNPGRTFVLGWGSGVTAAALARHSPTELTCVEISGAVIEASRLFSRDNDSMASGKATLVRADGRVFMASRPMGSYDLVVCEPSNPWIAGMSRLFTVEHFSNVRRILSPDGVFCQWIQSYEMDDETFRIIVRSFLSHFPGSSLWALGHHDFALLYTPVPPSEVIPTLDFSSLGLEVRRNLEETGLDSMAGVAVSMVMNPAELAAFAGVGEVNTDDAMVLQYRSPRFLVEGTEVSGVSVSLAADRPDSFFRTAWPGTGRGDGAAFFSGGRRLEILGDRKAASGLYEEAIALNPDSAAPRIHLAAIEAARRRVNEARTILSVLNPDLDPISLGPSTRLLLARLFEDAGNYAGALLLRETLMTEWPLNLHNRTALARNLRKTGSPGKSREILKEIVKNHRFFGPAWLDLGLALLSSGDFQAAVLHLSKAVELDPADATALHNLGVARMKIGDFRAAATAFKDAAASRPKWHVPLVNLAECLAKSGRSEEADGLYGELIERFFDNPVVLNNAGAHFAGRREYRRAIDTYRKLASADLKYANGAIAEIERLEGFLKLSDEDKR